MAIRAAPHPARPIASPCVQICRPAGLQAHRRL